MASRTLVACACHGTIIWLTATDALEPSDALASNAVPIFVVICILFYLVLPKWLHIKALYVTAAAPSLSDTDSIMGTLKHPLLNFKQFAEGSIESIASAAKNMN